MDESIAYQLFCDFVQLESPSLHEGKVARRCQEELERLGCQVEFDTAGDELGGETGNLYATLPGDDSRVPILLTAHMDTVAPGVGIRPQLGPDGVIRSDGTTILGADDKVGITAILLALRKLVLRGDSHGPIQVVFTIAEELGLRGSAAADAGRLFAKYGLCLDSGGEPGTFVVGGPSQIRWQAEVRGRAAHAGVAPEQGISAIQVAARAVARIPHGRIDAESTVNIGSFIGQGPTNVVRDKVQIIGEARSLSDVRLQQIMDDMEAVFREVATRHGAELDFIYHQTYRGFRFDRTHPLPRLAEMAARRAGLSPKAVTSGGGSDANHFTAMGIPTLNVGVGYQDIHSPQERVAARDIVRAARFVYEFLRLA
ncbi:M20/M25/M40 family metallo-hydrolase [Alicyclobacillus herbarius]|uniref:M20/M25/M40 family metallo-hydrolase n=1 Tax=Alicyclobacillus herbarius TaxID=122960 RepID=UPI00047E6DEF|nr:M20/M25/M40 family metallo-hydrolase [Alicyclobacillus herbarius]